jgi:alpha-L-rhamnosidase
MKTSFCGLVVLVLSCAMAYAADPSPVKLASLQAEHQVNPIGIGVAMPRLSWKLVSDRPGEVQTAYQIRAGSTEALLAADKADVWDSGKVASDQSVLVPWGGKALESRQRVAWQVRVWDKSDIASNWSDSATIEMGLLDAASQWKGKWITADLPRIDMLGTSLAGASWISGGATQAQPAAARYVVNLPPDAKIRVATIDVAAEGLVSLYVNGKATHQGASSHTAPFHADFGQQLVAGRNVIALFSLAVRMPGGRAPVGAGPNAIAAHGEIVPDRGPAIEFDTDGKWKAAVAPAGNAWYAPDYDDSTWAVATVIGPYSATPPIRSADGTIGPGRYLRKTFTVKGPVAKARLYSTALGVYEASINGKAVNDHQLDPGWTDYTRRVMVQTTDVTGLLSPGVNAMGAVLSDGWFAGRVGWMGAAQYASIGQIPAFNAQLEIDYADGTSETIATDGTWKGGPGDIVGSDQQLGEVIDARKRLAWDRSMFDDSAWSSATVQTHPGIALDPQLGPPVRKLMELAPRKITRMGDMWIVDFGQNMVGHIRLSGTAPAGTTVGVLHGEMLNEDGTVYNENLRQAISYDTFTFAGAGSVETFEPHFTFHGFRYAQITGYPGELTADRIRGIVVGSDTPDTGSFVCSNADVNQLFSNIRWGQRGNFLSVPTDCPQRDERQGWMGDAQVFAPTAAMNADVSSFFAKWMVDVNDGQLANGAFCVTSPRIANPGAAYPVWGDAGVIVPWVNYTTYGDKGFLAANYDHMAKWVDYCQRTYPNLLENGGVGDHLAPDVARAGGAPRGAAAGAAAGGAAGGRAAGGLGRGGFGGGVSTTSVVDTAYFARSAWIVSKSAAILGKPDDAAKYDKLFHDIAAAFDRAYVQADGSISAGTQTTYVLALEFDLLPQNLRAAAAKHLSDDVESRGHLSTGFVGVGWINPGLADIGRSDLAYQLLLVDTYPSWLFTIRQGATTMWERWDGYTPDKGFQDSSMNSFNHYSLGSVGKWLYSGPGGINVDESRPGFKHIVLQPEFSTKIDNVKVGFDSPYGLIKSSWALSGDTFTYDVTIPPNSSATLTLPAEAADVKSSGDASSNVPTTQPATAIFNLAAGTYHFSFPKVAIK